MSLSGRRTSRAAAAVTLVAALFVLSSVAKTRSFTALPAYNREGDRLLFWTESAFHYRYAKMAAEGKAIPRFDERAQEPEGLEVYRQITIAMEPVAGGLYRALAGAGVIDAPFHVFLVRFICWFSSLSIVALFVAARAAWRRWGAASLAAAAYALVPLSYARVIGHYGREDFALPLLFFFFAFFVRSVTARSARRALVEANVAGLFAAAALASWHLSRFFFLMFAPVIVILALLRSRPEEEGRIRLGAAVGTLTAWCAAAALAIPVLVEKRFLLSAPMLVLYASCVVLFLARRRRWGGARTAGAVLALALLLFALAKLSGGYPEYSHVYALIRYKLQYLGVKPSDPAGLPFEARILWSPPFNTPGIPFLIVNGGIFLLWGLFAVGKGLVELVRRRLPAVETSLLYLLVAFASLFALIQRVSSFVVFFLALMLPLALRGLSGRRRPAVAVLIVLSLGWQLAQDAAGERAPALALARAVATPAADGGAVPNYGNNRRLVEWIRQATPRDAVFLTWYPTGPMVLLDGDRPIILHSKFESSVIRRKYRDLLEGLYGSEEKMAAVCARYRADYFVFQLNFTLDRTDDSEVYRVGLPGLPVRSTAFLMHFHPEELRRFTPVYQDSYYRVFRFHSGSGAGEGTALGPPLPYEEVWERIVPPEEGSYMAGEAADDIVALLHRRAGLAEGAGRALAEGDLAGARRFLDALLELSPDSEEGAVLRARLLVGEGRPEDALAAIDRLLELRPESSVLWFAKGETLRAMRKPYRAARAYAATLERDPGHRGARAMLEAFGPG